MAHRTRGHELIIATYEQGCSVPEISKQLGVSDKHIYYVLKFHGIALRPRSGVGKVLTSAQEAEIVASYQTGIDAVQLAARYGISSNTVYTTLEHFGVARRTNSDIFRKLSSAQEAEVIALYQQGLAASEITGRHGIDDQTVYNILERQGVSRRSTSEAGITYPRFEHAFDVIDNETAAYWLGFIAADGNVSNGRLRVGLSTKDVDHVRKLASWISPGRPIYTGTNNLGRPVSRLEIGSQHLAETLGRYGIVPRKTYLMKQLPEVPPSLMRHLLRGYIDADGFLTLRPKYGATLGVTSFNREILEEIQNWLIQELGVRRTAIIHSQAAWHYRQYGTLQVSKICSYLYTDAQIYLDRKYERAQHIIQRVHHATNVLTVANETRTMLDQHNRA